MPTTRWSCGRGESARRRPLHPGIWRTGDRRRYFQRMLTPVNIESRFEDVTELWSPRVIGRVNDQYVKIARLQGEFVWHAHEDEDELFLVIRGQLRIQLEDGDIMLGPGEFVVVPRGVRHNPVSAEECWVMLVEPVGTKHTGDVVTERTRSIEQQLR